MTGVVLAVIHEPDGDVHVLLKLDPQYTKLLTPGNAAQGGNLVVEDVCVYLPTQRDAVPACTGFKTPFRPFKVGHRYKVSGAYALDKNHGSWAEIHGLTEQVDLTSA